MLKVHQLPGPRVENRSDWCSRSDLCSTHSQDKRLFIQGDAGALIPPSSVQVGARPPFHQDEGCSWGGQWLIPLLLCFSLEHPLPEGKKLGEKQARGLGSTCCWGIPRGMGGPGEAEDSTVVWQLSASFPAEPNRIPACAEAVGSRSTPKSRRGPAARPRVIHGIESWNHLGRKGPWRSPESKHSRRCDNGLLPEGLPEPETLFQNQ